MHYSSYGGICSCWKRKLRRCSSSRTTWSRESVRTAVCNDLCATSYCQPPFLIVNNSANNRQWRSRTSGQDLISMSPPRLRMMERAIGSPRPRPSPSACRRARHFHQCIPVALTSLEPRQEVSIGLRTCHASVSWKSLDGQCHRLFDNGEATPYADS
jgi:hypothetical protein